MTAPDVIVVGLRALSFVAVLQAAGTAIFLRLFGRQLAAALGPVRRLAIAAAVTGIGLTLAQHLLGPARMTGELSGVLDLSLHAMLLQSDAGTARGVRIAGLVLIGSGLVRSNRGSLALVGLGMVVMSFAVMGHTAAHEQRWILAPALLIHLLVIALWFGSLLPLYLLARHEAVSVSGALIHRFSSIATWAVPFVFLAGVLMAVVLLPSLDSLLEPYGQLIVAKFTGFAVLMGFAAANKWRLGPGIVAGNTVALVAFQRSVTAEWGVAVIVLVITAIMTSLFSPTH